MSTGIFGIAASALTAQSQRMNLAASNLANADSVSSSDGQPYRARQAVFEAQGDALAGVRVSRVLESSAPLRQVHDPLNPLANAQGLAPSAAMSDEDVWQLIFAAGFSTADQVTDVSGRGVGMDVVRRNIQEMGGHVQLSSQAGQGTTVRIVLPLTLAILHGMAVRVGPEVYILPLGAVIESLQPRAGDIHSLSAGQPLLHVRGEYLALLSLAQVFGVDGALADATQGIAVIVQAEGERFALLVDQMVGQHQVVVKNLESNYRRVPGISAATIWATEAWP